MQPEPHLFAALDRSSKPLRVWSTVLNCRVLFAGDRTRIHQLNPYPVYRSADLRIILRLKPDAETLRVLHEVKQQLGRDARIAGIEPDRLKPKPQPQPQHQAALFAGPEPRSERTRL